ncbi:DUF6501 family protein [Helicovermis profundi]|uniref:Uncharacterized protein n=1 Tax=Helicovermis profundi TaxID=3065157 RepID=A0AAU9EJZ4_9FIRM|nr:hypothetical protein HLPR_22290 [Clostridia bacterium S502]
MGDTKVIKATDTLRIHYTTIGKEYEVLSEDEECYKIADNRGKFNWVPKRYFEVVK